MRQTNNITFIVTKSCQLACQYCYLIGKKDNEIMTLSMAKKTIDFIFACGLFTKGNKIVLDFIGGEPLLEIDLISDILDYWNEKLGEFNHPWKNNYGIRITTNGLLYNSYKVQSFIEKYRCNLSISISIDGTKTKNDMNRIFPNQRGTYDKVINNVRLWIKQFPHESTKMTVSHSDLHYIAESVIHHINLGLRVIDFNLVLEDVWHPGDDNILESQLIRVADYMVENDFIVEDNIEFTAFDEYIGKPLSENYRQNPCGNMNLSIDAAGNIYTCLRFAKYSLRTNKPRMIGNVMAGINKNLLHPYLLLDRNICAPKCCIECSVASGCKRCPAEDYDSSYTRTIFQQTNFACKLHKAKVRAKNYYWNKLYNKYK